METDRRTTDNLDLVKRITGLDPWVAGRGQLYSALQATDRREVALEDSWLSHCLQGILSARLEAHYMADTEEVHRLQGLRQYIVTIRLVIHLSIILAKLSTVPYFTVQYCIVL